MTKYLDNAGLSLDKIQILGASIAEDFPNDTFRGSVRPALL